MITKNIIIGVVKKEARCVKGLRKIEVKIK